MKFTTIKTLFSAAILLIFCCAFAKPDGDFLGKPQEMEKNISDGAKSLIKIACGDFDPHNLHDHQTRTPIFKRDLPI